MSSASPNPLSVPAALQMVGQLRQRGQIHEAAQLCEKILAAAPGNVDALLHLGTIALQCGAHPQAVEYLGLAVPKRRKDPYVLYAWGCALHGVHRNEEAIEALQGAVIADPSIAEAQQELASCLLQVGRAAEALEHCQQAVKLQPDVPEIRHQHSQILQELGQREAALACHREALQSDNGVLRCQVIQAALAYVGGTAYLEIGVDTGDNLGYVWAKQKLAVDPIPIPNLVQLQVQAGMAQFYSMRSDEFFDSQAEKIGDQWIDVAFIDGLHTYAQTLRDVENCLKHLQPDGVLLLHDCNPTTAEMAIPAASYEDSKELREPGECTDWTGDVWKTIVHLRAHRRDLTVGVLNCDFGVGVVVPRPSTDALSIEREIDQLTYEDLDQNRASWLGLREPHEVWDLLAPLDR